MYQAIVTKYHGPTNSTGSRISARCDAKRVFVPYDHALSVSENHQYAALALADTLGWHEKTHGTLRGGSLPSNDGYAFVFVK